MNIAKTAFYPDTEARPASARFRPRSPSERRAASRKFADFPSRSDSDKNPGPQPSTRSGAELFSHSPAAAFPRAAPLRRSDPSAQAAASSSSFSRRRSAREARKSALSGHGDRRHESRFHARISSSAFSSQSQIRPSFNFLLFTLAAQPCVNLAGTLN